MAPAGIRRDGEGHSQIRNGPQHDSPRRWVPNFKTAPFNHSGTPPQRGYQDLAELSNEPAAGGDATTRLRLLFVLRGEGYERPAHRARAAFRAISDRRFLLSFFFRAGPPLSPPNRPSATAAGFFSLSPVASATMSAARTFTSWGWRLLERFGMALVCHVSRDSE